MSPHRLCTQTGSVNRGSFFRDGRVCWKQLAGTRALWSCTEAPDTGKLLKQGWVLQTARVLQTAWVLQTGTGFLAKDELWKEIQL